MEGKTAFPEILMEILAHAEQHESVARIITWLPDGTAFIIFEPEVFANEVLPQFLPKCRYTSFTRKLNRWGFKQLTKGPERGAFRHELFRRDDPLLCKHMTSGKRKVGTLRAVGTNGSSIVVPKIMSQPQPAPQASTSQPLDLPMPAGQPYNVSYTLPTPFWDHHMQQLMHNQRILAATLQNVRLPLERANPFITNATAPKPALPEADINATKGTHPQSGERRREPTIILDSTSHSVAATNEAQNMLMRQYQMKHAHEQHALSALQARGHLPALEEAQKRYKSA